MFYNENLVFYLVLPYRFLLISFKLSKKKLYNCVNLIPESGNEAALTFDSVDA